MELPNYIRPYISTWNMKKIQLYNILGHEIYVQNQI
jgi:hypothetical protein